jgi:hypothetical protein
MEFPPDWTSLRGQAQSGAHIGQSGASFVADISAGREATVESSDNAMREHVSKYLRSAGITPISEETISAAAFDGWRWQILAIPAQEPATPRAVRPGDALRSARAPVGADIHVGVAGGPRPVHPALEHALATFTPQ